MSPDEKLEQALISKIRNLRKRGYDVFGGTFTGCDGQVQLDLTILNKLEYQITYCCYERMWIFKILKTEIE